MPIPVSESASFISAMPSFVWKSLLHSSSPSSEYMLMNPMKSPPYLRVRKSVVAVAKVFDRGEVEPRRENAGVVVVVVVERGWISILCFKRPLRRVCVVNRAAYPLSPLRASAPSHSGAHPLVWPGSRWSESELSPAIATRPSSAAATASEKSLPPPQH